MARYTASMPLLPSALPPKGEARRYVANDFLNLIASPERVPFDCVRKRFNWFCRFYGFKGVGAAQIIMKRRGVLIALRAVVISSVAEKSILQNAHCLM